MDRRGSRMEQKRRREKELATKKRNGTKGWKADRYTP